MTITYLTVYKMEVAGLSGLSLLWDLAGEGRFTPLSFCQFLCPFYSYFKMWQRASLKGVSFFSLAEKGAAFYQFRFPPQFGPEAN